MSVSLFRHCVVLRYSLSRRDIWQPHPDELGIFVVFNSTYAERWQLQLQKHIRHCANPQSSLVRLSGFRLLLTLVSRFSAVNVHSVSLTQLLVASY